ncbi:MAG: hypothetical protein ABI333_28695, partial [bacterium]
MMKSEHRRPLRLATVGLGAVVWCALLFRATPAPAAPAPAARVPAPAAAAGKKPPGPIARRAAAAGKKSPGPGARRAAVAGKKPPGPVARRAAADALWESERVERRAAADAVRATGSPAGTLSAPVREALGIEPVPKKKKKKKSKWVGGLLLSAAVVSSHYVRASEGITDEAKLTGFGSGFAISADYPLSRRFLLGILYCITFLQTAYADPLQDRLWAAVNFLGAAGTFPFRFLKDRLVFSIVVKAGGSLGLGSFGRRNSGTGSGKGSGYGFLVGAHLGIKWLGKSKKGGFEARLGWKYGILYEDVAGASRDIMCQMRLSIASLSVGFAM